MLIGVSELWSTQKSACSLQYAIETTLGRERQSMAAYGAMVAPVTVMIVKIRLIEPGIKGERRSSGCHWLSPMVLVSCTVQVET